MLRRPAPGDVTFTSRWRQRSEHDEPRTYSADASVDHTSITPKRATTSLAASVDPIEARSVVGFGPDDSSSAPVGIPQRGRGNCAPGIGPSREPPVWFGDSLGLTAADGLNSYAPPSACSSRADSRASVRV